MIRKVAFSTEKKKKYKLMKQSQDFGIQGRLGLRINRYRTNWKDNRKITEIYRITRRIQNENQSLRVMMIKPCSNLDSGA